MRKTLGVSLLMLLLTSSAGAGIMPNDTPALPPSQPAGAVQETTAPGELPNPAPCGLTQAALDLLAVLPSLF